MHAHVMFFAPLNYAYNPVKKNCEYNSSRGIAVVGFLFGLHLRVSLPSTCRKKYR